MFPEFLTKTWLRLRTICKRRQLDRDLEEELSFHVAMREQSYRTSGVAPEDAQSAARRRFGNLTAVKEACRALWTFAWLESFWQDLRYGVRQLRRSPAFTLVAILSLALGIGANSAMFSVADFLVLRPLPVPNPGRVVEVRSQVRGQRSEGLSYPDYVDFRTRSRSFEGLAASQLVQLGVAARFRRPCWQSRPWARTCRRGVPRGWTRSACCARIRRFTKRRRRCSAKCVC